MTYLVVCSVAFVASGLTFFSGFGLGTLLLPAFALFFPVERAVALTAVVHFLNGLFKLALVGRHADRTGRDPLRRARDPRRTSRRVGTSATHRPASARELFALRKGAARRAGEVCGRGALGLLRARRTRPVHARPHVSAAVSAARQRAQRVLRRAFGNAGRRCGPRSSCAGLSKEAFVATGVVVACLIDVTRLGVYVPALLATGADLDYTLLTAAVLAAFAGGVSRQPVPEEDHRPRRATGRRGDAPRRRAGVGERCVVDRSPANRGAHERAGAGDSDRPAVSSGDGPAFKRPSRTGSPGATRRKRISTGRTARAGDGYDGGPKSTHRDPQRRAREAVKGEAVHRA